MLVLGIGFLFNTTNMSPEVFSIIVLFTIGITILMVLLSLISWKETLSKKIINGLLRIVDFITRNKWKQRLEKIKEETLKATRIFHDSMKEVAHNPKMLIMPIIYLILNWISSLAVPYLVFLSLGYPVDWTVILINSSIVVAVKSIPVGIPFEVGLPEITMSTIYVGFSVPGGIAVTATILTRLITLWLRAIVGFAAQQWVELKMVFSQNTNLSSAKS
jgi:uncharacterized protein (TIRG00374 family)